VYDYRYSLLNFETQNTLDAEWLKAGLQFLSVAPIDCAFVSFNSTIAPMEDPNAPVTFGRRKEFSKIAALHLQQQQRQQPPVKTLEQRPAAESYPSLTSRFYATVVAPGNPGRRIKIDIVTRSEFKSGQVFLQVMNEGDSDVLYSVPQLAAAAGDKWNAAVGKSMWKRSATDADKFALARKDYANLLLDTVTQSSESVIPIEIFLPANPGVVLGRARISAYLPRTFGRGAQ
jgi:hypothetical protein